MSNVILYVHSILGLLRCVRDPPRIVHLLSGFVHWPTQSPLAALAMLCIHCISSDRAACLMKNDSKSRGSRSKSKDT